MHLGSTIVASILFQGLPLLFLQKRQRGAAQNHGHRIDYFLARRSLLPNIEKAEIIKEETDSTNNPLLLDLLFKFWFLELG